MIRPRWLFVCSCVALVTSAFTFVVRGDILQDLGKYFSLNQEQLGSIEGAVFLGMAFSMFGGGFICDLLGMKRIMWLAFFSHVVGSLGTIFAPQLLSMIFGAEAETASHASGWLFWLAFLMGCGNGFTEVAINPLAASLFPKNKTHALNVLHAWWPGGLVIGGLSAQYLVRGFVPDGLLSMELWQTSLWLITIPALAYGAMLLTATFPQTERVKSGISNAAMLKDCVRPMFFVWAICMLMTSATELGPQKWQESVMRSTAGISGTMILVYTSGMMFVLRHFAGPIARLISPIGLLCGSAALAGTGLYLLSFANDAMTAFGYATIFGLGIAYFWPTMLGVTAERFPKGGALALALMGSVGNLSISQVLPLMGGIADRYAVADLQETDSTFRDYLNLPEAERTDAAKEKVQPYLDRISPLAFNFDDLNEAYRDPTLAAKIGRDEFDNADDARAQQIAFDRVKSVVVGGALDVDKVNLLSADVADAAILLEQAAPDIADQVVDDKDTRKMLASAAREPDQADGALASKISDKSTLDLPTLNRLSPDNGETNLLRLRLGKVSIVNSAQATGFSMAFRWVSILPIFLVIIFGIIVIRDRLAGGYKPELLLSPEEEDELLSGGVEGAVE